jgi:hypothetical protein
MKRLLATLRSPLRGGQLQRSLSWPMLQGRKERPQHTETEASGESGPISPADLERFRENPEEFAGDARFVGKQAWGSSEDNG